MTQEENKESLRVLKRELEKREQRIKKSKRRMCVYYITLVIWTILLMIGLINVGNNKGFIAMIIIACIGLIANFIYAIDNAKDAGRVVRLKSSIKKLEKEVDDNATKIERQSNSETIEKLTKYKELLDSGVITQEEFNKKKSELL